MTWEQLQKPFKGLHWYYRIITGTKYSYPFIKQEGYYIYKKVLMKSSKCNQKDEHCHLLNLYQLLVDYIKYKKFYKKSLYKILVDYHINIPKIE